MESVINLQQCRTVQMTVLAEYLGYFCQTFEQIGRTNMLLEWNSFVSRGLTVMYMK